MLATLTLSAAVTFGVSEFHQAYKDAESATRNLGDVLAEHTGRYLQVVDFVIRDVQYRVRTEQKAASASVLSHLLTERIRHMPQANAVDVFDTSGSVIAHAGAQDSDHDTIDRDSFVYLRDHPEAELLINSLMGPYAGTEAGTIYMLRRLSGPDGAFAGVVRASLNIAYLCKFYQASGVSQHAHVVLYGRDGVLLVRQGSLSPTMPLVKTGPSWFVHVPTDGTTFEDPGYHSSKASIISVHPLPDYPVVLDVGVVTAEALAPLWRRAGFIALAAVALSLAFIALFGLIARHIVQQHAHAMALFARAEDLRVSESRFRSFTDLASDWYWEQDADLRFTEITLYSPLRAPEQASILGRTRHELVDVNRNAAVLDAHQKDLDARRSFRDVQYEQVGADGNTYYISISGTALFDADGMFTGYRGIGRDVTATVKASAELRLSKERAEQAEAMLQDAVDSMSEGFVVFDAEERMVVCNSLYKTCLGNVSDRIVTGDRFIDIMRIGVQSGVFPDAVGCEEAWLKNRLERFRSVSGSMEQPLRNGRWVLATERRMRNGGTAGLRIDITAQKQAEYDLRASEARLDLAQEIAGIGSWERLPVTQEHFWSKAMYRITGLAPDYPLTRETLIAFVHHEDRPAVLKWFDESHKGLRHDPFEFRIVRSDGNIRMIRVDGRLSYPDGQPRRLVGTLQDITERRQVQQQLIQAQKMEALGNLTGGIAHDFNNMLGVVIGNLDLLARFMVPNEPAFELCDDALEGAVRCTELIRRLLAFASRQSLQPELTDANVLVSDIVRLLERTLGDNIAVRLDLDPALRPVMVDPAQLEAALVNLATNARDAMPDGGRLHILTQSLDIFADGWDIAPGAYSVIEIRDTGTGIDPEIAGRIFDPFFTTKSMGSGTGLGLSMTFGFVKQSGGHLLVESEPGHGAVFRIILPSGSSELISKRVGQGIGRPAIAETATAEDIYT